MPVLPHPARVLSQGAAMLLIREVDALTNLEGNLPSPILRMLPSRALPERKERRKRLHHQNVEEVGCPRAQIQPDAENTTGQQANLKCMCEEKGRRPPGLCRFKGKRVPCLAELPAGASVFSLHTPARPASRDILAPSGRFTCVPQADDARHRRPLHDTHPPAGAGTLSRSFASFASKWLRSEASHEVGLGAS